MITTYSQVSFWLGSVMCEPLKHDANNDKPFTHPWPGKKRFMHLILSSYHAIPISHIMDNDPCSTCQFRLPTRKLTSFPSPNLWTNKCNQYPTKRGFPCFNHHFCWLNCHLSPFRTPQGKKKNRFQPKIKAPFRIKHQTSKRWVSLPDRCCSPKKNIKKTTSSVAVHGHPHTLLISRSPGCHALSAGLGAGASEACCASCSGGEQLPPENVSMGNWWIILGGSQFNGSIPWYPML